MLHAIFRHTTALQQSYLHVRLLDLKKNAPRLKKEGFLQRWVSVTYPGDRGCFVLTTPNALTDSLDSLTSTDIFDQLPALQQTRKYVLQTWVRMSHLLHLHPPINIFLQVTINQPIKSTHHSTNQPNTVSANYHMLLGWLKYIYY